MNECTPQRGTNSLTIIKKSLKKCLGGKLYRKKVIIYTLSNNFEANKVTKTYGNVKYSAYVT